MKLLVTILALVALGSALDPSLKLANLWNIGAVSIAAPQTEPGVDGEKLKDSIINSYIRYIKDLNVEIERQYFTSVSTNTQESDARNRDIVNSMQNVWGGTAKPTEFDYPLYSLTTLYNSVSYLVLTGNATISPMEGISAQGKLNSYALGTTRYKMDQFFYGLEENVLRGDFAKIQTWLDKTMKAGISNVMGQGKNIEKGYRDDYLWPMVESLRNGAKSVEIYESYMQQYSTASTWKQYEAARKQLYDLPVNF